MQIRSHAGSRPTPLILAFVLAVTPCDGHGGHHEEIQTTDAFIAADPDNAAHWFHRSRLHLLHGDWMLALADLETAERLAPGKYPVELARGKAWMAGGKFPQARKALDAFIKSRPELAEGFSTRASLLMRLGDPDAAAADFLKALSLTHNPEPDLHVETANALLAANHPQEAIAKLESGMTKLGAIPSLAEKALEIELSAGSFDAALARVERMRKSAPRPEPWMAKRAGILASAGRTEESQAAWNELRDHLLSLPENERNSRSMIMLMEQTRRVLDSPDAALAVPSPGD